MKRLRYNEKIKELIETYGLVTSVDLVYGKVEVNTSKGSIFKLSLVESLKHRFWFSINTMSDRKLGKIILKHTEKNSSKEEKPMAITSPTKKQLEPFLNKNVQVKLFDNTVSTGFLEKTDTSEAYKMGPRGYYHLGKNKIFRSSHIKRIEEIE